MSRLPEHVPADATDRKHPKDALRPNAEAIAALVEQAPLGIYTLL